MKWKSNLSRWWRGHGPDDPSVPPFPRKQMLVLGMLLSEGDGEIWPCSWKPDLAPAYSFRVLT